MENRPLSPSQLSLPLPPMPPAWPAPVVCSAGCLCRPYPCTGKRVAKRKFTSTNVLIEEELDVDVMWKLDVDVMWDVLKYASRPVARPATL